MKSSIFVFLLVVVSSGVRAHEANPACVDKLQKIGYTTVASTQSCQISAGISCDADTAAAIQLDFPTCVERLVVLRMDPDAIPLNFCNMAAKRSPKCVLSVYSDSRRKLADCTLDRVLNQQWDSHDAIVACLEDVMGVHH